MSRVITQSKATIFRLLGQSVIYTPSSGSAFTATAIIDRDVAYQGESSRTANRRHIISILKADLDTAGHGIPSRDEYITVDGSVYTFLGLDDDESADDDYEYRLSALISDEITQAYMISSESFILSSQGFTLSSA